MTVNEKIKALRDRMSRHNIDIYIVPTCDFHGSEYVGDYFKTREYRYKITGIQLLLRGNKYQTVNFGGIPSCSATEDIFFRQKASLRTQRLSL